MTRRVSGGAEWPLQKALPPPSPLSPPTSHPQATYKKDHLETIGGKEYHTVFYSAASLLYRKTSVPMAVGREQRPNFNPSP